MHLRHVGSLIIFLIFALCGYSCFAAPSTDDVFFERALSEHLDYLTTDPDAYRNARAAIKALIIGAGMELKHLTRAEAIKAFQENGRTGRGINKSIERKYFRLKELVQDQNIRRQGPGGTSPYRTGLAEPRFILQKHE